MLRGVSAALLAALACATGLTGAHADGGAALRPENVTLRAGAARSTTRAVRTSVSWCGGAPSATDRKPDSEISSPNQVHAVYAVPSDGADRFSTYASRIASDAEAIDAWWQGQDPARTPRFDLYPFPGCTTKFGALDISSVRLPKTGAAYGGPKDGPAIIFDMPDFDSLAPKKILVYYDGPVPDDVEQICGTAYVTGSSQTTGGLDGFVFVWLQSICPDDVGGGAFSAAVAAHETLHTLGAVPTAAPHTCPSYPGHVCDSTSDILYPFATLSTTLTTVTLDVGRDDYYGHSGSWLDQQDSPWLTHLPQFQLGIGLSGSGKVDVVSPGSTSCARACTLTVDGGLQVTLRATPGAGSRFVAWSGACSGTADCTLTLDASKTVTAAFAPTVVLHRLAVSVKGKGTVTSTPPGISCPGRCSASFPSAAVRLVEKPAKGFVFGGWVGSCRGKARTCSFRLDRDKAARATFRKA